MVENNPYWEGWEVGHSGDSYTQNPYDAGTPEFNAWNEGYISGDAQYEEEREQAVYA